MRLKAMTRLMKNIIQYFYENGTIGSNSHSSGDPIYNITITYRSERRHSTICLEDKMFEVCGPSCAMFCKC